MTTRAPATCRSMALGARAAAARFARRRGQERAARGRWLPAMMRLRRWRRAPAPPRAVRGAAPVPGAIWAPRFHLHLGAAASDLAPRPMSAARPSTAVIHRTSTVVLHRHSAIVRLATATTAPQREHRVALLFVKGLGAVGRVDAVGAAPARWLRPAMAPLLAARAAHRPHPARLLRAAERARQSVAHEQGRASSGREPRARAREVALVHRRSAVLEADALRRRPELSSAHRAGAAELAWRRTARLAPPADEGPAAHPPASAPRPVPLSFPAHEAESEPPAAAVRSAPRPLTHLDPALVDRLAEDVIRRIEKRARIERERRGL